MAYRYYGAPASYGAIPPVIKQLLIANGVVFFLQNMLPGALETWFALWPMGTPDYVRGAFGLEAVPSFYLWQLFSYGFLHGGFTHLLFNMFALWMFGANVERVWGSYRFAVYYTVCVVGAGLVQLLVVSEAATGGAIYPTLGASGGVFGILLAFGMLFPNQVIMLIFPPIPMKAKYFVLIYGGIELYMGVSGSQAGVAHFAHLGGMAFGFLLIQYWTRGWPFQRPRGGGRW